MITTGIQIAITIAVAGDNSIAPIFPTERITDSDQNRLTDDGDERITD